jgi:hypothetical protein
MRYSLNKIEINLILSIILQIEMNNKSLCLKKSERTLSEDIKPTPGLELDFIIISSCLLVFIIMLIIIVIVFYRRKKILSANVKYVKAIQLQEDMEMTRSVRIEKTNDKVEESELAIKEEESKKSFSKLSKKGEIVFDNVKRVLKPKKKKIKENFIDEDQIRGYYLDTFNQEKRNHIIEKEKHKEKYLDTGNPKMIVTKGVTKRRNKEFGNENKSSAGSKLSMKKAAHLIVHRDLVQFTNSNRSSPESSYDEEDFEEEDEPVENIKAPMTMKQILNKVNKVLDEEDKKIENSRSSDHSQSSEGSDSEDESSENNEKIKNNKKNKKSEPVQTVVVDKIIKSRKRKGIVEQTIL